MTRPFPQTMDFAGCNAPVRIVPFHYFDPVTGARWK